jgi:hypothetical protein
MSKDYTLKVNRRKMLQAVGATGLMSATMAGCMGGGEQAATTDNGGATTTGSQNDFEGENMTFVTEETSDAFRDFYNSVRKEFEDVTGAAINIDYAGFGNGAVERAAQLAQGGNPPELVQTSNTQAARMYSQGQLEPVTEVINTLTDRFGSPNENYLLEFDDNHYFVPLWGSVGQYWYNSAVYDEEPNTWPKALSQAEKNNGTNAIPGAFISAGDAYCTETQFYAFAKSNGVTFAQWDGEDIKFVMGEEPNRQRAIETLEWMNNMHNYSPENSGSGCSEMSQAIATESGHAAFYPGARLMNTAIGQNKDFVSDLELTLNPKPDTDYGSHDTYTINDGLCTFKGSNVDLAKAFLEFIYKLDYMMEMYFLTPFHNLPAFPEIFDMDMYQSRKNDIINDSAWTEENFETIREQSEMGNFLVTETSRPNPAAGTMIGTGFGSSATFRACVEDGDPGKIVDDISATVQQQIDKNYNAQN